VVGHQRISADGRAGLSAYGGVEQYLGGGFGRRGGMRIAIHPGRQPGAVVEQLQLPPQCGRVGGSGLTGEFGQQAADFGAVVVRGVFDPARGPAP
jgi:hypothetical protein